MPYELYMRSIGHGSSLAFLATGPMAQARVAGLLASESGTAMPGPWLEIYRRAYEQARASLEPSRFQLMLRPCWN
jgi:hypothetical protein